MFERVGSTPRWADPGGLNKWQKATTAKWKPKRLSAGTRRMRTLFCGHFHQRFAKCGTRICFLYSPPVEDGQRECLHIGSPTRLLQKALINRRKNEDFSNLRSKLGRRHF